MLKEKLKKFVDIQKSKVNGPISRKAVITALPFFVVLYFIFYEYVYLFNNIALMSFLINFGRILVALNVIFLFEKRGFFRSIGAYLMFISGIIYLIVDFSWFVVDLNPITLIIKLSLPFIFAIIYLFVNISMINLNSTEKISNKSKDRMHKILYGPIAILLLISLVLSFSVSEIYMSWMITFLAMLLSPALITMIFKIIYPLEHKEDSIISYEKYVKFSLPISSGIVLGKGDNKSEDEKNIQYQKKVTNNLIKGMKDWIK